MEIYSKVASKYWEAGWRGVLPLPPKKKANPPEGFTGIDGRDPTKTELEIFSQAVEKEANICLRLPRGIIALDIDAYGDKHGEQTLAEIQKIYGPLPKTWRNATRGLDNPSGHLFFRADSDFDWLSNLGSGLDILQFKHRYAVVWPSIVTKNAEDILYQWIDPDGNVSDRVPRSEDFPELPESFHTLRTPKTDSPGEASVEEVNEFFGKYLEGEFPEGYKGIISRYKKKVTDSGNHHDELCSHLRRMVEEVFVGAYSAKESVMALYDVFIDSIRDDRGPERLTIAPSEFERALKWAIARGQEMSPEQIDKVKEGVRRGTRRYLKKFQEGQLPWQVEPSTNGHQPDSNPFNNSQAKEDMRKAILGAAHMKIEEVEWLWEGYILSSALCMLIGDGDIGKGNFCAWLISHLSLGDLPGKYLGKPVKSLFVSTEENYNIATIPRLLAHGADLNQIHLYDINKHPLTLNNANQKTLFEILVEEDIKIVILDPIFDLFPSDKSDNSEKDVRAILVPLQQSAISTGITTIGIRHENKHSTSVKNKGMGSKAFFTVPRSSLRFAAHPHDPELAIMSNHKANYGPKSSRSLTYTINTVEVVKDGTTVKTAKFEWGETTHYSAQDVMDYGMMTTEEKSKSTTDESKALFFVKQYFTSHHREGQVPSKEIYSSGLERGHKEHTLRRAIKSLEAISVKGVGGFSYWEIPVEAINSWKASKLSTVSTETKNEVRGMFSNKNDLPFLSPPKFSEREN